jgi:hypothetical protein
MRYIFTLFFIFSTLNVVIGQSADIVLRNQLFEVVETYIQTSDLADQSAVDPKCERFNNVIADQFISLFEGDLEIIQVPNLFSEILTSLDTTIKSSNLIDESELYISINDYYMLLQSSPHLKAFTYSQTTPVVRIYKHEKKIKGNQYNSVIGFDYQVEVCKGDQPFKFTIPVILTCVYQLDAGGGYTYPKIAKVEYGERPGAGSGFDFYFTPYIEASSGYLNFDTNKISEFDNRSAGNYGIGIKMQIRSSAIPGKLSSSYIIGIGYRQINYNHNLNQLNLIVKDDPPFETFEGIVADYSKEINIRDVKENTKLNLISVPIGMEFDIKIGSINSVRSIFISPGLVIELPLSYKSSYTSGTLDYTGNFTIAGPAQTFMIRIDDYGLFGKDFQANSALDNYALNKIYIAGELELGYKYQLNSSTSIKLGGFIDYGFTNIFKNDSENPVHITQWDGKMYSYPYFSSPVRNALFGIRLSLQNFGFQWKKTVETIGKTQ